MANSIICLSCGLIVSEYEIENRTHKCKRVDNYDSLLKCLEKHKEDVRLYKAREERKEKLYKEKYGDQFVQINQNTSSNMTPERLNELIEFWKKESASAATSREAKNQMDLRKNSKKRKSHTSIIILSIVTIIALAIFIPILKSHRNAQPTPTISAFLVPIISPSPKPTPSPTVTPPPNPAASPTPTPTPTPVLSASPTPSSSPTPYLTPTPTPTPSPTPTPTPPPFDLNAAFSLDSRSMKEFNLVNVIDANQSSNTKVNITFKSTYPVSFILRNPIAVVVFRETLVDSSAFSFIPDVKGIYKITFDNSIFHLSTNITIKGEVISGKNVPPQGVIFTFGTESLLYTTPLVPFSIPTPTPIIIYIQPPTLIPIPAPPVSPAPTNSAKQQELVSFMLNLLNNDRRVAGLAPVVLGNNVAAQKHAEDRLIADYLSHWGRDGMKPYMRYTLVGGYNYEAENGFVTRANQYINNIEDPFYFRDPKVMLEEAEKSLMNSPGHSVNILNKWHKEVNLGIAYIRGTLHLVQQFEGDYIRFITLPNIENGILIMAGETLEGFVLDNIQIWYDPLPHSLTVAQLEQTYVYNSGIPVAFIRPPPGQNAYYPTNQTSYSYTTAGPDPYLISPITTLATPNPSGIQPYYPEVTHNVNVLWIDAANWSIYGRSFSVKADLNKIISSTGKGVYTIVIWAKIGTESKNLTNYSIWIK